MRLLPCLMLLLPLAAEARVLTVGPGQPYASIAKAVRRAHSGDVVLVYPLPGHRPYPRVAVRLTRPRVTVRGVVVKGRRVPLSGEGFDYSGAGSVPRAIFQIDPRATGCLIEGFELSGATNQSGNGAGVRINQANHATLRNLYIHGNDMGVMSAGDGTARTAVNQRIVGCVISRNGSPRQPGLSHNLYLGGTSVTLVGCEVSGATTGHNVKSRAHHTRVEYSYVHGSANREFDLVDARGDTDVAGSHAVLLGNLIVKAAGMKGNRGVIHFGQDGGAEHRGTLYLVHNTIVSPYRGPIVALSAPGATARLINNVLWATREPATRRTLVEVVRGAEKGRSSGAGNWVASGFSELTAAGLKAGDNLLAQPGAHPPFGEAYHLTAALGGGRPWAEIKLPAVPGAPASRRRPRRLQYKAPAAVEKSPRAQRVDPGAFQHAG